VAIKLLKTKNVANRTANLKCFYNEIKILSDCKHPNVVTIQEASFNGHLVKIQDPSPSFGEGKNEQSPIEPRVIHKKVGICYCVMKLAEYGELFRFIEHSDRFSPQLSASLFRQLGEGKLLETLIYL
jgi:serine/threonine protein kinase